MTANPAASLSVTELRQISAGEMAALLRSTLPTYCEREQEPQRETLLRLIALLDECRRVAIELASADAALSAFLDAEEAERTGGEVECFSAVSTVARAAAGRSRERHLAHVVPVPGAVQRAAPSLAARVAN